MIQLAFRKLHHGKFVQFTCCHVNSIILSVYHGERRPEGVDICKFVIVIDNIQSCYFVYMYIKMSVKTTSCSSAVGVST